MQIESAFFEFRFVLLVLCSVIAPIAIYAWMLFKRSISRKTVLGFGVILVLLSGLDIVLLSGLAELAANSTSVLDDKFFMTELRLAAYLLPALFAGIGINVISHILVQHLHEAERQFDQETGALQPDRATRKSADKQE